MPENRPITAHASGHHSLLISNSLLSLYRLTFPTLSWFPTTGTYSALNNLRRANKNHKADGFAPIFSDICYHLTHYRPAAADIPVASDNPVHYADAIRYNARTPLQGSLLPLTRLV